LDEIENLPDSVEIPVKVNKIKKILRELNDDGRSQESLTKAQTEDKTKQAVDL